MNRPLFRLAFLILSGLFPAWSQQTPTLKPYVAPSRLYALQVPPGWTVRDESGAGSLHILAQSQDGISFVEFHCRSGQSSLLGAMGTFRTRLVQRLPGASMEEVWISPDRRRALADWRQGSGDAARRGRIYAEAGPKGITLQAYGSQAKRLPRERPVLLNIMASLAFIKDGPGQKVRFIDPPLVKRTAPDRSASLSIPEDWKFAGGGGKVLAGDARGSSGFIFSSFQGNPMLPRASVIQGIIGTRYLPPQQAMETVFRGFGHRDFRVTSAVPDQATMREYQARFGKRCEAQDLVATWVSSKGAACVGAFKVIDSLPSPMGMWNLIVAGIWAPQEDFYRYYPMLEKVGRSFAIHGQYAQKYIQTGLENLRRLQQQTMAKMKDLNDMRAQNQKDWEARQKRKDYMESKWDDYRRGESYWVSDLEGGKVYRSESSGLKDTSSGNYYEGHSYNYVNFEGENPRHPSETMREISSYELKELNGGR